MNQSFLFGIFDMIRHSFRLRLEARSHSSPSDYRRKSYRPTRRDRAIHPKIIRRAVKRGPNHIYAGIFYYQYLRPAGGGPEE